MQNGPDLAKRFYKELTDIQVRTEGAAWCQQTEVHLKSSRIFL